MRLNLDALAANPATRGLKQRALTLGAANGLDYALQFLLPVVLVRHLDATDFGQYRVVWLAAGTAMAVITQSMSGSLYYFLPQADRAAKRLYINQTLLFLAIAGFIAGWAFSAWNPWLPQLMHDFAKHGLLVPAFIFMWVTASLLDLLPTVEERVLWQAKATVGLSALRATALSLTAILTGALGPVLLVTLLFVAFKVAVLIAYVARFHGLRGPIAAWRTFADQLRLAAPFGASGALYGLRAQADQWVAVALFPAGVFASFSIAVVLGPLVNLVRQSVVQVFLPSMSKLAAGGDIASMLELSRRGNAMVAALVYPLLAFAFAFTGEIVTVVYTADYLDAVPVMRVYIIGLVALVVELVSTMLMLKEGAYAMRVNLVVLTFSIALSWLAAKHFGLAGAAMGSVLAIYADGAATLRRIALRTGMPLRQLQDWRALGTSFFLGVLASASAWVVVGLYCASTGPLGRLSIAAALMAPAYVALHLRFGIARNRSAFIRRGG